ncbi:MAG: DNA polymerase III subunit alpha [Rhabdochlamydiaceae bacterium]
MNWIPLHVHSQYSILSSTVSLPALIKKAKEYSFSSLALTDKYNLHGAVDFFKLAKSEGIKPLIGCEIVVAPFCRLDKKKISGQSVGHPITLIAKNIQGYRNLCKLSSLGYLEGFYYTPRIDKALLEQFKEGLICLSGNIKSSISTHILKEEFEPLNREIEWYFSLFKEDYYFECQNHSMLQEDIIYDGLDKEGWVYQTYLDYVAQQQIVLKKMKELSLKWGIKAVATNDTHYLDRQDWQAQEILMNIQSGEPCEIWEKDSFGQLKSKVKNPKREILPSHEMYFKSSEQMQKIFSDWPEALEETVRIGEKCDVQLDFKTRYYPLYIPPHLEGVNISPEFRQKEANDYLRKLCLEGIPKRYTPERLSKVQEKYPDKDASAIINQRLNYELDLIISKGMCDYLLIVYDFIHWAKQQNIPMGPGRGSGAGSIILYLIGITDIEPLRFNLFFERFINPERISYPDIDVDICMERRAEVIEYTVKKYGKDRVAQIITFGTMKAKMAIKDVGRVLSVPLPKVNMLTKLVPEDPNITLDKAFELDPELSRLYESDPEIKQTIDIAKKLEGSIRNTGIHAAGLIIGGQPILDLIPACTAKDSEMMVTQYSMKPVEAVGMLKIDFLGLKTLTAIQKTIDAIYMNHQVKLDWVNLPLDDQNTFNLLNQGRTMGVFQLESGGMQDLARQLHIDKFEEIVAVGALYRPGPMEMIPSFINRKHQREEIENDHPLMRDVLAETYGIMVYQEQVMQIASLLANYSLGEGDVLRRAMGKKDKEEMAKQREKFKIGALSNGINESTSSVIFDKIEKFASYGFNKSHAAAYGYLTYVTAFLKANYSYEWMAALMTTDKEDITKVAKIIREAKTMGINILPPDVNESGTEFRATANGIRFALTAIKGVGEGIVHLIENERKASGVFLNLYDFFKRIDTKKIGKKVVEYLVWAGCFDYTGWSRSQLAASIDEMYEAASKEQEEKSKGIINLFALLDSSHDRFSLPPQLSEKINKRDLLNRENELLGFYLSGHPMDEMKHKLIELSCVPLSHLQDLSDGTVCRTAFIIETVSVKVSAKNQKKFAILMISDGLDRFELPVWSDLYESHSGLLQESQLIYAIVIIDKVQEEIKLQLKWLTDLTLVDLNKVKESETLYEKLKFQNKFIERKSHKKSNGEMKTDIQREQLAVLSITIDLEKAKLSHFLALKDIFRSHPGEHQILIDFVLDNQKIKSIFIDKPWGIFFDEKIKYEIKKVNSIIECKLA